MAFVTKTWTDRLVEYAGRRKLKNVATGEEVLMDVSRSEGTVSRAGDAFSAASMNNLEQRIKNEFDTVNSSLKANNNQIYMDYHDGKYGINTSSSRGADTFIPFKSDLKRFYTTITGTSALTQYTVGFKPKIILFCVAAENRNSVAIYDGITNKCYYNGYFDTPYEIGSWVQGAYRIAEINDTGFKAEFLGSWSGYPVVILAFG